MSISSLTLLVALFLVTAAGAAQTDSLRPYDNLVVEGIPPIPPDVIRGVGRYTECRSAGFNSWDPVGREMLISTRFAETNQIHRVKFPGGARTQLTFFTDRVGGASYGPKDPSYFVFSKDIGGGEWFQLYRYDAATGDVTLLTDGKSRNSLGAWSNAERADRLYLQRGATIKTPTSTSWNRSIPPPTGSFSNWRAADGRSSGTRARGAPRGMPRWKASRQR